MRLNPILAAILSQTRQFKMDVGINTAWLTTYLGPLMFNNLMYLGAAWNWVAGTKPTSVTQSQGLLSFVGADATTEFRMYLSDHGVGLPAGDYTLLNPSGCNLGIGAFAGVGGGSSSYSTATTRTFTRAANQELYLYTKGTGGITNAGGNIVFLLPGTLGDWQAGNIWNQTYLNYITKLGAKQVRFMDAVCANTTIEVDWADRCDPNGITLNSFINGMSGKNSMPHEFIIDLCNRLGIKPWVNVPVRASLDYKTKMAQLYASRLQGSMIVEGVGNETWNYAAPFNLGFNWMSYLTFTKYTATVDAVNGILTRASHGLANGDSIQTHWSKENRNQAIGDNAGYKFSTYGLVVTVLDANRFQLRDTSGFTGYIASDVLTVTSGTVTVGSTLVGVSTSVTPGRKIISQVTNTDPDGKAGHAGTYTVAAGSDLGTSAAPVTLNCSVIFPSNTVNVLYNKAVESGKTSNNDLNTSAMSLESWNAFTTAFGGTARVKRVLGSQSADPSHTATRYNAPGVAAAVDEIAIAPYFNGLWWVARAVTAVGSITPGVWTSRASSVRASLFLATDTPSQYQLANGIGAVATQVLTPSGNGQGSYEMGTPWTTTDGTAYKVYFWTTGDGGTPCVISGAVSSGAVSAVNLSDTFDAQAQRARYNSLSGAAAISRHKANAPNAKICIYECGYDYTCPSGGGVAEQATFVTNFLASQQAADALSHHYYSFAMYGATSANYYADYLGGLFSLTPSGYTDTTSPRFLALADKGGFFKNHGLLAAAVDSQVPLMAASLFPNLSPDSIPGPPAYPYTVAHLPAGDYTYRIVAGDYYGNYSISGNSLVMNKADSVDFATPSTVTLVIEASDGFSSVLFNAKFVLGDAWYATDALFVFDSTQDSDTTSMDPVPGYGGSLAKMTASAQAVASGGLWAMSSAVYQGGSAMTSVIDMRQPLLIAMLLDGNGQAGTYSTLLSFGNGKKIYMTTGGNVPKFQVYMGANVTMNNTSYQTMANATFGAGNKHVHWVFFDPVTGTVTSGYDQTQYAQATVPFPGIPLDDKSFTLGGVLGATTGIDTMKHGSIEVVNRPGMVLGSATTKGSVKQLVRAMQTLHGLP